MCAFVLIVIALLFFLEIFVSSQNQSVYGELDLLPTGDLTHSQQPVQNASESDVSVMSREGFGEGGQSAERAEISDLTQEVSSPTSAGEMQEQQITEEFVLLSDSMASSENTSRNSSPVIADPSDRFGPPPPGLSRMEGGTHQTPDTHPKALLEQTVLVRFSFDSDELLEESQPALEKALAWLRENPESTASIKGFADNQGDKIYNLRLSRLRAEAVEEYLVGGGVARQRLQADGMGAFSESAENPVSDLDAGMEQYRVVQITIANNL